MGLLIGRGGARIAIWIGLGAAVVVAAPVACLFPDYTFDAPGSGGSGAGTTTTTSNGGGGSTTTTNPENCMNGVDDDSDGNIDCADPKCTDHACVPEVPADWTGYYALYDGAPAGDPGCPQTFPSTVNPAYLGNNGINVPPATCACSCTAPQWGGCAALDTITMSTGDAPCGSATTCTGTLAIPGGWTGTCYGPNYYPGGQLTCGPNTVDCSSPQTGVACNASVTASELAALNGTCQPNPVSVTRPDVAWATLGHACGDSGTVGQGCNLGQGCVPRPPVDFESGVCISHDGDVACPAGAFTVKHVYYSDVTDTRDCTNDCSCGPASGGTCPTTITIYSDTQQNTCNTQIASFAAGTCANVNGNPSISGRKASAPGAPTGGSCTPSGGVATGTATPASPRTFCCIP